MGKVNLSDEMKREAADNCLPFLVFCIFAFFVKKGIAIIQECGIMVKLRQISEV